MPRKRRTDKRRADPALEYEIWGPIFASGFDHFDDLPALGLPKTSCEIPLDLARVPWATYGERWLSDPEHGACRDPGQGIPWAEERMGRPWARPSLMKRRPRNG